MPVTSIAGNEPPPAGGSEKHGRPSPKAGKRGQGARRHAHVNHWIDTLRRSDVGQLWNDLHQIVSSHPLVRASRSAGLLIEEDGRGNAYLDLTQELFVTLLSKKRFQHYIETNMTDAEIECEISQIELTNLLTAELRKRHPESYRIARRISTIIQASANFRRFDGGTVEEGEEPQHRRLAERVYGLKIWDPVKPQRPSHELEQRVRSIPVRQRDTRLVGCTGDAQIIINNSDLEDLIIAVLEAVDSPVDMRALRSLVMSRLPVMDIYLVPLGGESNSEGVSSQLEPVDGNDNPEQGLLRRESETAAGNFVNQFLESLREAVRGKTKQYDRMLGVLWYCYLCPDHITQIEAAAFLNVSDSLVSDYRQRIETQLRSLSFSGIEEARQFEASLRETVRGVVIKN
jgi:hypothetical protein